MLYICNNMLKPSNFEIIVHLLNMKNKSFNLFFFIIQIAVCSETKFELLELG